ncbi:signal peptidase I [Pyxidicoccus xibeiensis]|uniref:signal peptidase I n=1 Tax=Pyxidicoccus xibeiensis TaxID=2906759 RepID=UPI002114CB76
MVAAAQAERRREDTPAQPPRPRRRPWAGLAFLALLVVGMVLLRTFAVRPLRVISGSMEPTLQVGERVVMDQLTYRFRAPEAGDIVVFAPPPQLAKTVAEPPRYSLKRVVAVPGQVVQVLDGKVLVDGQPRHEPYVAEPASYTWGPSRVPEGTYFVLGDNRNASADSHAWGFLPAQYVLGRAWLRFWPLERAGRP